jgi:hypothetical protein
MAVGWLLGRALGLALGEADGRGDGVSLVEKVLRNSFTEVAEMSVGMLLGIKDGASLGIPDLTRDVATETCVTFAAAKTKAGPADGAETNAGPADGANKDAAAGDCDGAEEDGDAVATAEPNGGPVDGANKDADAGATDEDTDSSSDEVADSLSQIKGHSILPVTSSGIEN